MGKYISTGKWAKSKNLAQIMASKSSSGGSFTRVRKKRTKAYGVIYGIDRWVA